jgi:hypothetical protein
VSFAFPFHSFFRDKTIPWYTSQLFAKKNPQISLFVQFSRFLTIQKFNMRIVVVNRKLSASSLQKKNIPKLFPSWWFYFLHCSNFINKIELLHAILICFSLFFFSEHHTISISLLELCTWRNKKFKTVHACDEREMMKKIRAAEQK